MPRGAASRRRPARATVIAPPAVSPPAALPPPKTAAAGTGRPGPGAIPADLAAYGVSRLDEEVKAHPERFEIIDLDPDDIAPNPFNPAARETLDPEALSDILPSVKERGVDTPITVCERAVLLENSPELAGQIDPDCRYVAIVGGRRKAASILAGRTVPGVVRNDHATRRALLHQWFTENVNRTDFTPLQEARGFDLLHKDGLTLQQIVDLGLSGRIKSKGQISKRLKLLSLTPLGQQMVDAGTISVDSALALLAKLPDPASQDRALAAAAREEVPLGSAIEQERRRIDEETAEAAARALAAGMGLDVISPGELWGEAAVRHRIPDDEVEAAKAAGDVAGVTVTGGHITYYRAHVPGPVAAAADDAAAMETVQPGGPQPQHGDGPDGDVAAAEGSGVSDGNNDAGRVQGRTRRARTLTDKRRQQEHHDASRARKAACRKIMDDFGEFRDRRRAVLAEILTDGVLAVDVSGAALKLPDAAAWSGVTVGTGDELDQILGGADAQRLALAAVLAACEKEAADSRYISGRPWPAVIRRHVRRLADLGYHELSPYETEKLSDK